MQQEKAFPRLTTGIPCQRAAHPHDTMAGNDNTDRILPHRPADSTGGSAQLRRHITISACLAVWDAEQGAPHPLPKRTTARSQRQGSGVRLLTRPICRQPLQRRRQPPCRGATRRERPERLPEKALPLHPQPDKSPIRLRQIQPPHRRTHTATVQHAPILPHFFRPRKHILPYHKYFHCTTP